MPSNVVSGNSKTDHSLRFLSPLQLHVAGHSMQIGVRAFGHLTIEKILSVVTRKKTLHSISPFVHLLLY